MKNVFEIEKVISSLNWKNILDYHQQLNILWDFTDKNGNSEAKIPTIKDIQSELYSLLTFMIEEELNYYCYGNWNIFIEHGDDIFSSDCVKVIFGISNCKYLIDSEDDLYNHTPFIDINEIKMLLESKLNKAIAKEDFEAAAILRDSISNLY